MFAPHPLEDVTVACCQGNPCSSLPHAFKQVLPGARLFSGSRSHATNVCRSRRSKLAGVYGRGVCIKASPTASAIWVSSVTRAGSPSGCRGPPGGKRTRISCTRRNSPGAPSASPQARPKRQPEARRSGGIFHFLHMHIFPSILPLDGVSVTDMKQIVSNVSRWCPCYLSLSQKFILCTNQCHETGKVQMILVGSLQGK